MAEDARRDPPGRDRWLRDRSLVTDGRERRGPDGDRCRSVNRPDGSVGDVDRRSGRARARKAGSGLGVPCRARVECPDELVRIVAATADAEAACRQVAAVLLADAPPDDANGSLGAAARGPESIGPPRSSTRWPTPDCCSGHSSSCSRRPGRVGALGRRCGASPRSASARVGRESRRSAAILTSGSGSTRPVSPRPDARLPGDLRVRRARQAQHRARPAHRRRAGPGARARGGRRRRVRGVASRRRRPARCRLRRGRRSRPDGHLLLAVGLRRRTVRCATCPATT